MCKKKSRIYNGFYNYFETYFLKIYTCVLLTYYGSKRYGYPFNFIQYKPFG